MGSAAIPHQEPEPELEQRYTRLVVIAERMEDVEDKLAGFAEKMGPPKNEPEKSAGAVGIGKAERTDFLFRLDMLAERMEHRISQIESLLNDIRRLL